jgi:hypothetical protein
MPAIVPDAATGRRLDPPIVGPAHASPRREVRCGVLDALLGPAGEGDAGAGFGQGLAHGEAQGAGTSGDERADSSEFRVRRLIHAADLTVARR